METEIDVDGLLEQQCAKLKHVRIQYQILVQLYAQVISVVTSWEVNVWQEQQLALVM